MNNIKRGIGGTYVRSKTTMVNMQIEKDFFQCGSCFPKKNTALLFSPIVMALKAETNHKHRQQNYNINQPSS